MRKHATVIGRAFTLGALALSDLILVALGALTLLLSFGMAMIFLFPPVVRLIRYRTGLARRLNGTWLGAETQAPYRPPPLPSRPQADGWYRHERRLYKTPRRPDRNKRWQWMFSDPATWRDGFWLFLNPMVGGAFLLLPFAVIGYCLVTPWPPNPVARSLGLAAAVAAVAAMPWLLRAYGWWNSLLLAPTATSMLAGRVQRLDQVRLDAVDSQAAELRRIERDLHDGAQARLVAIGMTLGAVEELMEKDPVAAKALLGKVREASSTALTELRGLVRGIHPPVLAERGLGDAVRALALDSPLKVTVTVDLKVRPESPVESAAYFSISELLANAARHGGADRAWIDISSQDRALRVTVTDDGSGGADPSQGSGLQGIERRLAAFDGVLAVNSPPGGPTTATFDLPTALLAESCGGREKGPPLPRWKIAIVAICWSLASIPLFPQGLVTMIFKIMDREAFSWFFPLYLPEPWQWPVIIFNIALGVAMYTTALLIPMRHSHRRWMAEATPSHIWFTK